MRILFCHPVNDDRGGHACLCTIDLELTADVRLYGLRLMRMRDGRHLVFAPQAGQRRVATFSPELAARLTAAALEAYEQVAA